VVLSDCCAASKPGQHERSLAAIEGTVGLVMTSNQVLAAWAMAPEEAGAR
jgi:hypothetical protein